MTDHAILAIDLGGTTVKGELLERSSVSDATASPLAAGSRPTPRGSADDVLTAVVLLARDLLEELPQSRRRHVDVGLAVPGLVDARAGIGRRSVNLGWRDAAVARHAVRELGLPVAVVHDVTSAGLAEHRLGAGRGVADLVVVVIGTGLSAVLVAGGRLVTGGAGQAGELGHVVVRPGGPRCGCGRRGCLEAIASGSAIARRYEELVGRPVEGALEVRRRLGLDPGADRVWREAVDALADGLLATTALLGPSRIVVGGGLAAAGDALVLPLREAVRRRAGIEVLPEIVPASFGGRAGLVGAALAVTDPDAAGTAVHRP